MYRYSVFVAVFLFFFDQTLAQTTRKFWIGPKVGVNFTQIAGTTAQGTSRLNTHGSAGLTTEYRFSPRLSLSADLMYARLGGSYPINDTLVLKGQSLIMRFNYISLPLLLRFHPKRSAFFIEIGGQASWFLSRQVQVGNLGSGQTTLNRPVDAGWLLGIGQRITKHLNVQLRYYRGLTTVYRRQFFVDPQTGQVIKLPKERFFNQTFGVQVCYYF